MVRNGWVFVCIKREADIRAICDIGNSSKAYCLGQGMRGWGEGKQWVITSCGDVQMHIIPSPKLPAKAPEHRPKPKRKAKKHVSPCHHFAGANSLLVSGSVSRFWDVLFQMVPSDSRKLTYPHHGEKENHRLNSAFGWWDMWSFPGQ